MLMEVAGVEELELPTAFEFSAPAEYAFCYPVHFGCLADIPLVRGGITDDI